MVNAALFDEYMQYRYLWNECHPDPWDALWIALAYATPC